MATTDIISNRECSLGSFLSKQLQHAIDFRVATAFINSGGLDTVLPEIERILLAEGSVHVVHGADFRIADPSAVRTLAQLRANFGNFHYYVHVKWDLATNQQFHPKLYVIESEADSVAIVGSSNLTRSGLFTNDEVNVVIQGKAKEKPLTQCNRAFGEITRSSELIEPSLKFAEDYGNLFEKFNASRLSPETPAELEDFVDEYSIDDRDLIGATWVPNSQLEIVTRAMQIMETSDSQLRIRNSDDQQRSWTLDEVYRVAEVIAKTTNKNYKWDTFHHSIRRSINVNVVDNRKGQSLGLQLFQRNPLRPGEYTLTEAGRNYTGK